MKYGLGIGLGLMFGLCSSDGSFAAEGEKLLFGFERGEVDKAIAAYEKATGLRPGFAEAHYNLGIAYRKKKQLDKSISALKQAVEIHPAYAKAHYHLAIAYYYNKQYKQALMHCNKAIDLGGTVDPKLLELLKPYG